MHQLDAGHSGFLTARLPIQAGGQLQMPAPEQIFLSFFGHALPFVGLELEPAMLADVREVRGHCADSSPAARHLDHHFGRPAHHGAPDVLDLGEREASRLRRSATCTGEDVEEGLSG